MRVERREEGALWDVGLGDLVGKKLGYIQIFTPNQIISKFQPIFFCNAIWTRWEFVCLGRKTIIKLQTSSTYGKKKGGGGGGGKKKC
jgi:hypothetical protein